MNRFLFSVLFFLQVYQPLTAQDITLPNTPRFNNPALVQQFYLQNNQQLFWYTNSENALLLRTTLINIEDSVLTLGLKNEKYRYEILLTLKDKYFSAGDSIKAMEADKLFTDAAITLSKDIYQGAGLNALVSYDEISVKYTAAADDFLLNQLLPVKNAAALLQFIEALQPATKEYNLLKRELQLQQQQKNALRVKQLQIALNYLRWLSHFKFDKMIVVNIASASLMYYEGDSIKLKMKVVVGKPATKTPRFAAYCNQVILYPYWNVPASIALNELLPKFKRQPAAVDAMNMQVIDHNGAIVDPYKISWKNYNRKNFPYRFRQSTGCDNSLGVVKFNITDPYSVYLHDTNNKISFFSGYRYYSHGCIRLEQPIELANILLNGRIDTNFLNACYKQQVPVPEDLVTPVPVFVIYNTVEADAVDKIKYYKDVYALMKL